MMNPFSLPQVVLARAAFKGGAEFLAEVRRQKAAGTWDPATKHYAAEGAGRFVRAIASGDLAPKEVVAARCATCSGCPTRVPHPTHPGTRLGTCGPPVKDRTKEAMPSCGCGIEIHAMVASVACPQEKYPAVPRVGAS